MSLLTMYTAGLNYWDPAGEYEAILVDGYTPDPAHVLADVLPFESAAVDYARNGPFFVTETIDDVRAEARLDAADLVFGTLAAGDPGPSHLILVRWITDDASSIALYAHDVGAFRGTFPNVHVSARGLLRTTGAGLES